MCTYEAMASSMNGGLAHGLSGVPFWSHDTGGFAGRPSDELFLRWAQFGALSPLLRFHGTTSREPWKFPAVEQHVIEALRLRYELLPYLYSAALRSAETGEPVMRAMMVDSPDDPLAWRAEHQYRLGRDLLVAPMVHEEQEREVYFPEGEWMDWWTGEVVTGPCSVRVRPPLEQASLYARVGALIATVPPAESIPDGPWSSLTLISVGGGEGTTEIRDDDGITVVKVSADGFVTAEGPARIDRVVELGKR